MEKAGTGDRSQPGWPATHGTGGKRKDQVSICLEEKKLGRDSGRQSARLWEPTGSKRTNTATPAAPPSWVPLREPSSQNPTGKAEAEGDRDEEIYFKELAHMTGAGEGRLAAWPLSGRS